jgi:hypothetical protein
VDGHVIVNIEDAVISSVLVFVIRMVCDGSKIDVMGTIDEIDKLNVLKSINEFKLA